MSYDITLGRYIKSNSTVHILDPRNKIILIIINMITILFIKNYQSMIIYIIFLSIIMKATKIDIRHYIKAFKAVKIIFMTTILLYLIIAPEKVFIYSIRLLLLISISSILMFTTTIREISEGIEDVLKPLKKIRIPVQDVKVLLLTTIRYISLLVEVINKIRISQRSRGVKFYSRNIKKMIEHIMLLVVNLFSTSYKKVDNISIAMESRGYNENGKRTRIRVYKYSKNDYIAMLMSVFILVIVILVNRLYR